MLGELLSVSDGDRSTELPVIWDIGPSCTAASAQTLPDLPWSGFESPRRLIALLDAMPRSGATFPNAWRGEAQFHPGVAVATALLCSLPGAR